MCLSGIPRISKVSDFSDVEMDPEINSEIVLVVHMVEIIVGDHLLHQIVNQVNHKKHN